jgi:hypothetical protein
VTVLRLAIALVSLLAACSASERDLRQSDGGSGASGAADAAVDAGECGPFMFRSGSICIDKQPALLGDGSQGLAVSWADANTLCTARGARLCTEAEREGACPGGQEPSDGGNQTFCSGPANTWEWSAGCVGEHRRSPCCAVAQGFGECTVVAMEASYRCCMGVTW